MCCESSEVGCWSCDSEFWFFVACIKFEKMWFYPASVDETFPMVPHVVNLCCFCKVMTLGCIGSMSQRKNTSRIVLATLTSVNIRARF